MKPFALAALLAAALAAATPAAAAPGDDEQIASRPPVLRSSMVVAGDYVRLGDLFDNAGEYADKAVAQAPQPGRRAVFDARWLYRVARAYGLNWRPTTSRVTAVVQRDSHNIPRDQVEQAVLERLTDAYGLDGDHEVSLSNRALSLHVAIDQAPSVAVEDLAYDPRTRRFSALIVAPAGEPSAQRIRVSGRAERMIEVPVPAGRIEGDDVIDQADLAWLRVPANKLQRDVIVDPARLIGKTPRRGSLRAGAPVRQADVQHPLLVEKRRLVTMVLRTPFMVLTAQGKAEDDGAMGDVVSVRNIQSNTVVEAVVTGAGMVTVIPPSRLAMN